MTIDAHNHFWRYAPAEYSWIDDSMAVIRRDFLPADLREVAEPRGVAGTIAVQARQSLEETRWLLAQAAADPFVRGVVGWAPLADPGIAGILDELATARALRGLRHVVQGEPDPGFLARADFNAGLRAVGDRDLVYDLLIRAAQLPAAIDLVDRHPRLSFVLDHIAKPRIDGPPPPEWRAAITDLARRENVACKLSGLVTEVVGRAWTPGLLAPYFEVVLEAFGPSRLMFGSDWPVCLVASDYARWFRFVEGALAPLSADERAAILGGTATATYRLT